MQRVLLINLAAFIFFVIGCTKNPDESATSLKENQEPSKDKNVPASLKIGDPAPALKVTKWLQGDPVPAFEPGKIYVVEFWATWCGACIRHMPHLAELQDRYKDQDVTAISFTSRDIRGASGNSEDQVAAFLKKRGTTLNYTFAYADDGSTEDAWLKAAGQEGFCTFVVDKSGRIAYMGGPIYLDLALSRIVAGDATAKDIGDQLAKVDAEYRGIAQTINRDPKAGLRAFAEFETKYPPLADFLPLVSAKLHELIKHGNPGQGKEYGEKLVAKAIKQRNAVVLEMTYFTLRAEKDSKELLALAVQAAEACVRLDGGQEPESLLHLADAYFQAGDKAKAKEHAQKAIDAAAEEAAASRENIEKEARKLGA
jgi:thiol-disulfide isomerase/thioredoxin